MSRRDSVLAALVASVWGFNFVVIDWGMGSVPPLLFAAIRFTFVALRPASWCRGRRHSGGRWQRSGSS